MWVSFLEVFGVACQFNVGARIGTFQCCQSMYCGCHIPKFSMLPDGVMCVPCAEDFGVARRCNMVSYLEDFRVARR